jgi:hypothetical protein
VGIVVPSYSDKVCKTGGCDSEYDGHNEESLSITVRENTPQIGSEEDCGEHIEHGHKESE